MYWKAVMASDAARSLPVCEPTICSGNLLSPAINLIIEKLIKKGGSAFPLILSVCVCLHTAAFPFLSACLLYSRLVLNLQKFIRYKLLLPSYHFIAAHRIEFPFSLLSCSSLPSYCFFLRQSAAASSNHPVLHPSSPSYPTPLFSPPFQTPGASCASFSSRSFRV